MKSHTKTTLTLALLLPLAGCWNCSESKKEHPAQETAQTATQGHGHKHSSKCSHKGCNHDHSKDQAPAPEEVVEIDDMMDEEEDDFDDEEEEFDEDDQD